MPKFTLAERLQRADARKLRAEQETAKLKKQQIKARTRRLIEIGGLAVKAGIDELASTALYDRFLSIATESQDKAKVTLWERAGSRHFQREEDARVVAIARFPGKVDMDVSQQLRAHGFRFNRFLTQWEGKVLFEEAAATVKLAGGTIEKVKTAPPPPPAPPQAPPPAPPAASAGTPSSMRK
ncbi:MAG: hypothetical protein EPO08_11465 [Rhodospirillaceae bacterium]|nr:MAG: hypothetical protein EPO08_11465 [Rhodospirillaceae bacterium]